MEIKVVELFVVAVSRFEIAGWFSASYLVSDSFKKIVHRAAGRMPIII
jgi:hypothetical protein